MQEVVNISGVKLVMLEYFKSLEISGRQYVVELEFIRIKDLCSGITLDYMDVLIDLVCITNIVMTEALCSRC